jgi:hypothetical protein
MDYVRQHEEASAKEGPSERAPELFEALAQFLRSNRPTEDAQQA